MMSDEIYACPVPASLSACMSMIAKVVFPGQSPGPAEIGTCFATRGMNFSPLPLCSFRMMHFLVHLHIANDKCSSLSVIIPVRDFGLVLW